MMDECHPRLSQHESDTNWYRLGRIGSHNVVMACLPAGLMGISSAATVAAHMSRSFRFLRFGLLVGVAGGAPSSEHDIRLGDIVFGMPGKKAGGVIQYDFGKAIKDGQFEFTGTLNAPPPVLLTALAALRADPLTSQSLDQYLAKTSTDFAKFSHPGTENDKLFKSDYDHVNESDTCDGCDDDKLVQREPPTRQSQTPVIHYGTVASANQVMKHGATRERLRSQLDNLCFEMEAAGLVNTFPCLVIRGICDYADTHKNKQWQPYASATAAAAAKLLLTLIPPEKVKPVAPIPSMRWYYSALTSSLVPLKAVSLGRLVLDARNPWRDYCPQTIEPPTDDIMVSCHPRMREILQKSKGKVCENIRRQFMCFPGLSFDEFMTAQEKTHVLRNSGNHFRNLCDHKETQLWFEKTVMHGCNVYMITAFHTIEGSSISVDSATSGASEQVFATQYQKVKFRWFSSRSMKTASLDVETRWKIHSLLGRDYDNTIVVDDVMQAELDDVLDLKELESEGDVCEIEDEIIVL